MSDAPVILVVEDNPVTRKMLRVALESDRYVVIEAADARAALEAAEKRRPGLILQDLILPDMNGFELVVRLRELPGGDTIPILALSGFRGELEGDKARKAGFTAFLEKPIEPDALADAVALYLPRPEPVMNVFGRGRHVLVVDDDAMQLKLLRLHLLQLGFKVTPATSTAEALSLAHRCEADLILSDVLMPDVDGFQLCLAVRSEPRLASVPIVLMSAHYINTADHELARRLGANALITRTPDFTHVGPALADALEVGAVAIEEGTDALILEHARAVIRQLARQTALSAGLARRCTLQGAQLSLLGGIADALARRSNSDVALRDVLAATLDAAAISKGALFLLGEDTGALVLRHGIGFSEAELEDARNIFGHRVMFEQVIEEKLAVSLPSHNIPDSIAGSILRQANVATAEIVPLVTGGLGIGAIMLGAKRTDMTSDDSITFARAIGNQIVQSLELERSFVRLAESEQRYRTLMEHANDGIAVFSPNGVIREVNHRFVELFGKPRQDLIGRNLGDFIAPDKPSRSTEFDLSLFGNAGRGYPPIEVERGDGSTVLIEFSSAPLELHGEHLVLAIGRDVTAHVRAQAQLMVSDRMASMGAMAAGVAHEINNPLAAVVGNLECAQDVIETLTKEWSESSLHTELRETIRDAREAADRVKVIVADTKLLSRVEEHHPRPVDVHRVIESALRMTRHEVRHRANVVLAFGSVPRVLASESRLSQLFVNLIVNAAQAIPEGHAQKNEIRIRTVAGGDGTVIVEVEDTGQGIAPEDLRKIFTPFFTTKPKGVGTGLGLAICQRILSELNGRISLTSDPGRGTCVRLLLPGTHAEEDRAQLPALVQTTSRRGRILVVDDEVLVGALLRRQLGGKHDVTLLTKAEDALSCVRGGDRFDVILCDLMMPTMTGMEFHAELKRIDVDQTARIVFLTGGAFTPAARSFLSDGNMTCLEKPFDSRALQAVIEERLRL